MTDAQERRKLLARWPIVVTGFTGVLACSFDRFHEDAERVMGHPIWTHQFGDADFAERIKEAYRAEFLELVEATENLQGAVGA